MSTVGKVLFKVPKVQIVPEVQEGFKSLIVQGFKGSVGLRLKLGSKLIVK